MRGLFTGGDTMKRILVVAAVIRRDDRILIARRAAHQHQGGLWEFPGGKVEPGETVSAALVRELKEELDITPTAFSPLIRIEHDYPDKSVCLDVWTVTGFVGEPHGREGQPLAWVAVNDLAAFDFPAANRPIVTAIRLPERYLITPEGMPLHERQQWLAARLAQGARLILFRAPELSAEDYRSEALALSSRCRDSGATLMLHGDASLMTGIPAGGLHLPARQLRLLTKRPVPEDLWLAASVHDELELNHATRLGVDFVTLSPVAETLSHPDLAAIGWERFADLVRRAAIPVYALGGMRDEDVARARQCGAQGVAGIRGLFCR